MPRPKNARREAYRAQFGLTKKQARDLREWKLDMLDRCQSDEARRLLLGVSEKFHK